MTTFLENLLLAVNAFPLLLVRRGKVMSSVLVGEELCGQNEEDHGGHHLPSPDPSLRIGVLEEWLELIYLRHIHGTIGWVWLVGEPASTLQHCCRGNPHNDG